MFIDKKITAIKPKSKKVVIQVSGGEKFEIRGAKGVDCEFLRVNGDTKKARGAICEDINIAQELHMQKISGAGTLVAGIAVLGINDPNSDKFVKFTFKVSAPLEMADTTQPFLEIYSTLEKSNEQSKREVRIH